MNIPGNTTLRMMALVSGAMLCATAAHAAVEISAKLTANMTCSGGVCSPTAKKAVLNVNDLATMLASGDVKIASTKRNQDIEIDAKFEWASTQLTLDAYRSISFNKSIAVSSNGRLTITTNDGGSSGDFQFFKNSNVKFSNVNSKLTINTNHYALAKSIDEIQKLIHQGRGEQYIALADKIDAAQYRRRPLRVAPLVLEGLGNTISNLTLNDNNDQSVGLFAGVATVRDLGMVNVSITGLSRNQVMGTIAGVTNGAIVHCYSTGTVSATGVESSAGGLVGENLGPVIDSYSTASVAATGAGSLAGGLSGGSNAGNQGEWNGSVQKSYATGTVTVGDGGTAGGLVGYNNGGAIDNSYANGAVTGGANSFVGGLSGANGNNSGSNPTISTSYSIGLVTGGTDATVGGLIGEDLVQTGTTLSYWDLDTSGISNPSQGAGNVANDPGITGLGDTQLKLGLPLGFDRKVWKQKPSINNGYPYLIDNPPPK